MIHRIIVVDYHRNLKGRFDYFQSTNRMFLLQILLRNSDSKPRSFEWIHWALPRCQLENIHLAASCFSCMTNVDREHVLRQFGWCSFPVFKSQLIIQWDMSQGISQWTYVSSHGRDSIHNFDILLETQLFTKPFTIFKRNNWILPPGSLT